MWEFTGAGGRRVDTPPNRGVGGREVAEQGRRGEAGQW
jgi:hypothetical protein